MAEMKTKKQWYKRWWAIILFIIIGLVIIGNLFGGNDTISKSSTNNLSDVWSKFSGYSVDECYEVCDKTYDIMAQVTICQGNCDTYGKPSSSLDKYVNTIKDIKNRK